MKTQTIAQNDQYKAIISIPGWAEFLQNGGGRSVTTVEEAYLYVGLFRRALKLRTNAVTTIPWHLEVGGKVVDDPEWPVEFHSLHPETFSSMLMKTEAALCLSGNCLWKKRNDLRDKTRAVQWLNPNGVEPHYNKETMMLEYKYNGGEHMTADEVVSFNRFNPLNDVEFGGFEGQAALENAKLLYFLPLFASTFFEHGAMPVTILGVPIGTPKEEAARLEKWYHRATSGIRNAFKTLAVRTGDGGIKPTVLTQNIKDMATPELYDQAVKSVADAFEIPHTMLQDAANFATAKEHRTMFWHDVMRPEGIYLQNVINSQLLNKYNIELVFDFDTMDQFQQDEKERSAAFFNYVGSKGIPPSVSAEMLGLELPEGVEYAELDEWYKQQTIDRPLLLDQADTPDEDEEEMDSPRKYREEVAKWRRRVMKRIKSGKSANGERSFESDIIPAVLITSVEAQLENADETKAAIIFENLREWRGYP